MVKKYGVIASVQDLYGAGLTVAEIAHVLDINPDFVKEHVKDLKSEATEKNDKTVIDG